ncbi:MAG: DUF4351 domain-containing protein [Cyanobium sp. CZS 25K]|nr:DUF4351 domain-containing protein [Cyanobium sp. CZS25K]
MKSDHWFFSIFQSAPDLIALLLPAPGSDADLPNPASGLEPEAPGDRLYRFDSPELKDVNHRLDGVLWPRRNGNGTAERPVVLLEVQMQSDPAFHHRLAAQTYRFLQKQVAWLSLEELSRHSDLHPLLNLLTLPVRPAEQLGGCTQQILRVRPDLVAAVLPMLIQRFPQLSNEEIMVIAGIPLDQLRHTRAAQQWLEEGRLEGRQEGRQEGEIAVTLRLLNRRCGTLSAAATSRIQALPLEQLEALADALLDFQGPEDLAAWLDAPGNS